MLIRVWKDLDLMDLEKHLLVVGDLYGDCNSCKELGLTWQEAKVCPQCQTPFKYVTLRQSMPHGEEKGSQLYRIAQKRPDLIYVDYADFKKGSGKDKAHKFFQDS